jgi:SpoVK/Ycf46/Vps4 family AAA+-type ATPase
MKKNNYLTLSDEFLSYCKLNNIEDIEKLANDTFNRGFTILKYGETPMLGVKQTVKEVEVIKEVPVEKIVEIIKEVPIEKIVEVIKEVPVNNETTVIKEEVIKEVKVVDNTRIKELEDENKKLKEEIENISKNLEKFNRAAYMKNSDLNSLYGE